MDTTSSGVSLTVKTNILVVFVFARCFFGHFWDKQERVFFMILTSNVELNSVPFNFDCDWLKYYVGWNNDKKHELDYEEFTQL
ncbi:5467_t:CDS:2 [Funneliformis geosporum]|nr:5467_t:CDS:2 [Funneliformis geosporum]